MECNHQRYYNNELECLVKRRPQGVIRCANSSTCEDSSMSIPTGSLDACSCSSPLQPPKSSQHSKHPRLAKDYWTACLLSLVVLLGGSISLPGNQTSRLDTVVPVDLRSYARLQTNPKFLHTTIFDVPLLPTYLEMPNMEPLKRSMFPHYNDLVFESLVLVPEHRFQRVIDPDERKIVERYRYKLFRYMEKHDLRSREKYDPWDDLDFPRECVRPQWTFEMYPACNLVHDIPYDRSSDHPLHGYDLEYLGSGAFREAILFNPPVYSSSSATSTSHGNPPFVIKSKIDERDLDRRDLHKINTEALIFEKLSASRVTSNMYAHCGSSIVVEAAVSITEDIIPKVRINNKSYRGYMKQSVLDTLQQNDVYPMNRFTNEEKLDIAIAMAESLAEMHGFVGSVITNDDISLDQWYEIIIPPKREANDACNTNRNLMTSLFSSGYDHWMVGVRQC
jgi:hypothetical protein